MYNLWRYTILVIILAWGLFSCRFPIGSENTVIREIAETQYGQDSIIVGAEPFAWGSGPVTVLMVHGFLSSPNDFRGISNRIKASFDSSQIHLDAVLLPGHGTTPFHLEKTRADQWVHHVEKKVIKLLREKKQVILCGFSTGGTICLRLAEKYPVKGVILISPFLGVTHKLYYGLKVKTYTRMMRKKIRFVVNEKKAHINDRDNIKHHITYRHCPLRASWSGLVFADSVFNQIDSLRGTAAVFHASGDETASPRCTREFVEKLKSPYQIRWFERSNHLLFLDYEKEILYREIVMVLEKWIFRGSPSL